jgi:hypothetical protein
MASHPAAAPLPVMVSQELRDGIFALHTRRFGRIAEHMIQALAGLGKARGRFHDLFDDLEEHRVEVKFSRVLRSNEVPVESGSVLQAINEARAPERMVSLSEAWEALWDCNIQQIKRAEFDVLYYGLFFSDCVICFRASTSLVHELPGYSDFQHKGNVGEGQFHLTPLTLRYHLEHHRRFDLTYDELLNVLTELDRRP